MFIAHRPHRGTYRHARPYYHLLLYPFYYFRSFINSIALHKWYIWSCSAVSPQSFVQRKNWWPCRRSSVHSPEIAGKNTKERRFIRPARDGATVQSPTVTTSWCSCKWSSKLMVNKLLEVWLYIRDGNGTNVCIYFWQEIFLSLFLSWLHDVTIF